MVVVSLGCMERRNRSTNSEVSNFSKKREVTTEFQMTVREVSVTLKTLGQAVKCVCESNHDNLASSDWQTHKPTCTMILISSFDFPSFVQ